MPCDVDALRALCDPLGIPIVEDAACAAGSTYRGLPVGRGAAIAAWSFHPRKVITTGEGGMLTMDDPELAARARRLREHGMDVSASARHAARQPVLEHYLESGFNFRMTDIQAAIGLVQLQRLDEMVHRRRMLAARYHVLLDDVPGLRLVYDPSYGASNFQSFWIELSQRFPLCRNELLSSMAQQGVSARRGIMAAHLEPAFAGHPHGPLPVTERLTGRTLILPIYHTMTEAEQDLVVRLVRGAAAGRGAA
jgi:dTDP-4-amino-4,6-dideoxygalactose transaminase